MLPRPIPIQGPAAMLFELSRTAKRDIQGYIVGQYDAKDKAEDQHAPTAETRLVFYLRLREVEEVEIELSNEARRDLEELIAGEDDDMDSVLLRSIEGARITALDDHGEVRCMANYDDDDDTGSLSTIEEGEEETELAESLLDIATTANVTSDRETKRIARLERNNVQPSLAHLMAMAKPDDFLVSSSSNGGSSSGYTLEDEHDSTDIVYEFKDDTISYADKDLDLGVKNDEDTAEDPDSNEDLPLFQTADDHLDTAPTVTCRPAHKMKRHNGAVTLATLIARAQAAVTAYNAPSPFFSSSVSTSSSTSTALPGCYDPGFLGHAPCIGRDQQWDGCIVDDALTVLRGRLEDQEERVRSSSMFKASHRKELLRGGLVHGKSSLRVEILLDNEQDVEIEGGSSPLPMIIYDNGHDSLLSSWFDNDVNEPINELHASEIYGSDDGVLKESSSLFDEEVEEYDDRLISTKTSREDVYLKFRNNVLPGHNASSSTLTLRFDGVFATSLHNASSKDDLEINYAGSSLRDASSTDTLGDASAVRTLFFSNGTSVASALTSKSSTSSVRSVYSRLIDALNLEIDKHKCTDGCTVCMTALKGFSIATIGRSGMVIDRSEKRVVSLPVIPGFLSLGVLEKDEVDEGPTPMDREAVVRQAEKTTAHRRFVSLPVVPIELPEQDYLDLPMPLDSEDAETIVNHNFSHLSLRRCHRIPDTPDRIGNSIDNFLTYITTSTDRTSLNNATLPNSPASFSRGLSMSVLNHNSLDLSFTLGGIQLEPEQTDTQMAHEAQDETSMGDEHECGPLFDKLPHTSRRRRWAAAVKRNTGLLKRRCVQGAKRVAVRAVSRFFGGYEY